MRRTTMLAVGLAVVGGTLVGAPAQAAGTATINLSTTAAVVREGAPVVVTGTISRPDRAPKVAALQYLSGKTWYTVVGSGIGSKGTYSFTLRRSNPGIVPYRVVVRDKANRTIAISRSRNVAWYAWTSLNNVSDLRRSGDFGFSAGYDADRNSVWNGRSYPHSKLATTSDREFIWSLTARINQKCVAARWYNIFDFEYTEDRGATMATQVLLDGDGRGVSQARFVDSSAPLNVIDTTRHTTITWQIGQTTSSGSGSAGLGSPAVLCLATP